MFARVSGDENVLGLIITSELENAALLLRGSSLCTGGQLKGNARTKEDRAKRRGEEGIPPLEPNWGFPDSSAGKESTCNSGDPIRFLGREGPLEEGTATHSSILTWRIPWTEEAGGL